MSYQFRHQRRVQFFETDLAGIVHFSNFFRYMEEAEHAFYRSLGFSVHKMVGEEGDDPVGWPRVHASADYRKPLKFEDEFEVELLVAAVGSKTIDYQFRFLSAGDELLATGKFTVICVRFDKGEGRMRAVTIPDAIRSQIEVAPAEALSEKSVN
ncbi:MAG: acyl-CoA thioester hydrolase [Verrucomicrobiales bacterium]|jgi:acyl-CoA thioester hydrolase